MSNYFPAEGEIEEGDVFSILYHVYKHAVSGVLEITAADRVVKVQVNDGKIMFALSDSLDDSLGNYLANEGIIDRDALDRARYNHKGNSKRLGRVLVEMGLLDYDQLWNSVQGQVKQIVCSLFPIKKGRYRLLLNREQEEENIIIDWDILSALLEGVRNCFPWRDLEKKFAGVESLYIINKELAGKLDLKPYEYHVFKLVEKYRKLDDVLSSSELLKEDTFIILNLLIVLEVVSTRKEAVQEEPQPEKEYFINTGAFKSFEEALNHYNLKYEIIYKALTKEIGPIAFSILSRAVDDILENLPLYMRKIKLNPDGTINKELVSRSIWHHDFNKNIGEFLRGLEEILYAEIYTVKKHLGQEYEQMVLKWVNRVGN